MRPLGTIEQLEKRRQEALELVRKGKSSEEIANKFGVTERSVRRWRQERKQQTSFGENRLLDQRAGQTA